MLRPIAPVVALDIGNVCVDLAPDACAQGLGYESIADLTERAPVLWQYSNAVETGQISDKEFLQKVIATVPVALSESEALAAWCSLISGEMAGMAEVVREFVAWGLQPVFFSDISESHFRHVVGMLSFMGEIGGEVLSCRVAATKPDERMFRAMEERYCDGGVPALYLDDRPHNIAGAVERGWNAHVFTTLDAARPALEKLRETWQTGCTR